MVKEGNDLLKHTCRGLFVCLICMTAVVVAGAHTLNIDNNTINLVENCTSDHKLKVQYGNTVYCAEATTDTLTNTLHVSHNGTTYSICNGACSGGGEWVMPEEPGEPIVITDPECTGPTLTPNAYLLSDGNQWFDTGVAVNPSYNLDVQVKIVNGKSARIFGTNSSSCWFDMTLDHKRRAQFRFGSTNAAASTNFDEANSKKLLRFETENQTSTKKGIKYYINGAYKSTITRTFGSCSTSDTIKIFKNNLISNSSLDQTDSGGMKLYYIKLYDTSGNLIHDFEPVPAGTNVCGHMAQANCMWDTVDKKLYYPAGTGQMGYGVDQ